MRVAYEKEKRLSSLEMDFFNEVSVSFLIIYCSCRKRQIYCCFFAAALAKLGKSDGLRQVSNVSSVNTASFSFEFTANRH